MDSARICIFTETYYPVVGGGEIQARQLAEGLVASGLSVTVLTRRSSAALKKKEQVGPVMVHRLPPVGSQHLKKWGLVLTGLPALIRLRRQYDLIFVSGFRVIGIPAMIASQLLGKICILKADSLGEMSGEFFTEGLARFGWRTTSSLFRAFVALRNRILRGSDCFVAVSSAVAQELLSQSVNPDRIKILPNSVDIDTFCPVGGKQKFALREKLDIPPDSRVAVYTGRLVAYKGLPLLLEVWQKIRLKHGSALLLLVGSGGLDVHNCEDQLKRFVIKNGLHNSVRFTGDVQNVHEYLQASDLFVFPTNNEAFGISLIEAMACGLPVISTSVGGVKDIVQHLQNGIVIAPESFQQLYDALDRLISEPSAAVNLGQAAMKDAGQKYSAHTVTKKFIELFNHAAGIST
jgi:glycosyltransferase involved in cell wall biosynthesis